MEIFQDENYLANTYNRFAVELVKGKGARLWDNSGKEYIDLGSGIAVNSFGACDPEWFAAVTAQAGMLQHCSNLYHTAPQQQLAKLLCEKTGMKKVFFSNSGAEANECAIKVARKYSADRYNAHRCKIITLTNSFHGRTLATLAATGQDAFHQDFLPLMPGFVSTPADDWDAMEALLEDETVCAVLMEPVQGEGGVVPLSVDFVQKTVHKAKEKDVLVMFDEVQTGNGRSGRLYAYEYYNQVQPDVVTTAKGLAGGLPLGATLFGEKTADVLTPGTHGSTFGGNPVCAAGALSVLERLDEPFLEQVRQKATWLEETLLSLKGVEGVSGIGLMLGITTTRPAIEVANRALEAGVLVLTAKQKVRLLPPLNIPMHLLKAGVDRLAVALSPAD